MAYGVNFSDMFHRAAVFVDSGGDEIQRDSGRTGNQVRDGRQAKPATSEKCHVWTAPGWQEHSRASGTWRAPCLWYPFPASNAGGAGARPDHPITGHKGCRPKSARLN
jgi:hypothetical protein